MISCGPVAVAIEQRPDDAAIQDSIKSFVFLLRFPFGDDLAILRETSNVQPARIRRATTPANIVRSVFFLKRLRFHFLGRFCETPGPHDSASDTDALQSPAADLPWLPP